MNQKTEFTRKCPTCDKDIYYVNKKILKVAIKKNTECYVCANTGHKNPRYGKSPSDYTRRLLQKANSGKTSNLETKIKQSINYYKNKNGLFKINQLRGKDHPNFGRKLSKEAKIKISQFRKGKPLSQKTRDTISKVQKGRTHSEETKLKMRLARINHIIRTNGGVAPRYSLKGCKFFEKLEQENGWNGYFATKNKEYFISQLGYFVDYYEPKLNVVFEYDDDKHYNIDNSLRLKDIIRMNEIKKLLKCRFLRFNERTGKSKEY